MTRAGENPGVHFLLNQKEYTPGAPAPLIFNELRTEEITDAADVLFLRVKELLSEHQRLNPFVFVAPAMLTSALTIAGFAFARTWWDGGFRVQFVVIEICLFFITFLLISAGGKMATNSLSLESKVNSASFFVRNREEFAKQAVTATISAVAGGIVGFLLGRIGK